MTCGLCESRETQHFYRDEKREWDYYRCDNCGFLFRDPETYLSHEEEKKRYETHNNSIRNEGYVNFLTPVVEALTPYVHEGMEGLDFGSGPGPILDQLFARHQIKVHNFDPYFSYQPHLLNQQYDFVTCTEVFEHFTIPFKELRAIDAILKPKAYFLIMTEMYQDLEHFKNWGYRQDPTHICFLNQKSLEWLAKHWNYDIIQVKGRISLLQKK